MTAQMTAAHSNTDMRAPRGALKNTMATGNATQASSASAARRPWRRRLDDAPTRSASPASTNCAGWAAPEPVEERRRRADPERLPPVAMVEAAVGAVQLDPPAEHRLDRAGVGSGAAPRIRAWCPMRRR